jgi:CRISPR-associated protein Cas2
MSEQHTIVLYDIRDDRLRLKVSEACLDYGLQRIQYSAFCGKLTRNKRQELFLRLKAILEEKAGKLLVQPVCEKDVKEAALLNNAGDDELPEETPV